MWKRVCRIAAVVLLIPFVGACALGNDVLVLARDGQPLATIVVAREAMDEPAPTSQFAVSFPHVVWKRHDAARELQTYIQRISGARLPIVADDQPAEGALILVGESRYTRELGLTNDSFARQEYLIRTVGNRLILIGRDQVYDEWMNSTRNVGTIHDGASSPLETYQAIGTNYAVTTFLEDYCGVRWYLPGEIGQVVPKKATLAIPPIDLRRKPSTRHRMVRPDLIPPKFYIEPRLYQNVPGSRYPAYDRKDQLHNEAANTWGRRLKLGGDVFVSNHSLYGYYDRFAKDHPDWFANGRPARGHMVNFASRDLLQQVIKDARACFDDEFISGVAIGPYFSVVPMDNETWSNDPASRAMYENGGVPIPGRWPGTLRSNYVWSFVAKVANEVARTHRDGVITCVAYRAYMGPPSAEPLICTDYHGDRPAPPFKQVPDEVSVPLPPNVAVQMCVGYPAMIRKGPGDFHNWLFDEWARKVSNPDNVYIWSYWLWPTNPAYRNFPNVNPREVGELARAMKRRGFTGGIYCQIDESHGHWWSYPVLDHLRVYVMAKVFENWDLDENEIVEEYYELFYGPARRPLKQFWDYLHNTPYDRHPSVTHPEEFMKWHRDEEPKPNDWDWTVMCPPEDIKQLGAWLDEGRGLVPEDSVYRKRIDLVDDAVYKAYIIRASREALAEKERAVSTFWLDRRDIDTTP